MCHLFPDSVFYSLSIQFLPVNTFDIHLLVLVVCCIPRTRRHRRRWGNCGGEVMLGLSYSIAIAHNGSICLKRHKIAYSRLQKTMKCYTCSQIQQRIQRIEQKNISLLELKALWNRLILEDNISIQLMEFNVTVKQWELIQS